jgi:hypothetical protein
MTKEQMRFHAAAMAMQGILSGDVAPQDRDAEYNAKGLADFSVEYADALLSTLYPSNEDSSVVPDEDGWTRHTPGDPMPCNEFTNVEVMFPDREVLNGTAGYWRSEGSDPKNPLGNWDKCEGNPNDAIIAWRPSL